jgi:hypothetical protein
MFFFHVFFVEPKQRAPFPCGLPVTVFHWLRGGLNLKKKPGLFALQAWLFVSYER